VTLSTHVLDTSVGRPAAGVAIRLETASDAGWLIVVTGHTDDDGRLASGWAPQLAAGVYRLVFDTGAYFGLHSFYPQVTVEFRVTDPHGHYHVPLLISPYGFTTYRGS